MLALAALAGGREIVVSRGQLVEIGDGFRIPEIVQSAGARLREVGTTNRTRPADYTRALGAETGAILCVHPSNYRVLGFTGEVDVRELARIAHDASLPLVFDVGSGALLETAELAGEPLAREALRDGCDLVCFSGDKLLGGPQAGILAGSADADRRLPPPSAGARAAHRQALARGARGHAAASTAIRSGRAPSSPCCAPSWSPPRTCARAPRRSAPASAAASSRRSRASAAARCRWPSCRRSASRSTGTPTCSRRACASGDPAVLARVSDGALVLDCRTLSDADAARISAPA